jgi:hypothetical protein
MAFKRRRADDHEIRDRRQKGGPQPGIELAGQVVVWLSPVSALSIVLGRLLRAVAATSQFTLDSMSELAAVSDALGAYAEDNAADQTIGLAIDTAPRRLKLLGGPFRPAAPDATPPPARADDGAGDGQATRQATARRQQLSELVEQLQTVPGAGCDLLAIVLADHTRDGLGPASP